MANIFVSHRIKDNKEAELLANDLKKAGHHVWLDVWEINIGDSIIGRMNQGLEGATYLVLCYSDAGLMSEWISNEWQSTLTKQLNGEGIKILPVLLTGGKPPAVLAHIKYADLVNDYNYGLSQLLKAIK